MATYQNGDLAIDPQLAEAAPSKSAVRRVSGTTKRKVRNSTSNNSNHTNHAMTTAGATKRITRRSTGGIQAVRLGSEEPSRGEEENLISYVYTRDSNKRSRIHSPEHNAQPQQSHYGLSNTTSSQPAETSTNGSTANQSGMDGLANAASTQHNVITRPGYPFGLTPFRYPCLSPHHPPPPPGDPTDPNFHPFDPSSSTSTSTSTDQAKSIASFNRPAALAPAPAPTAASAPTPNSAPTSGMTNDTPNYSDFMSVESNEAAFQSLSALLAASQSTFLDDNPNFGQVYPQSPGERSDGQSGPLTSELRGRYSMASRADCNDCRNGTPGHGGHWVRSGN